MPVDPRTLTNELIGTRLRDAAVNPKGTDFLGPTNAGEDNPHGPTVVNPQIRDSRNPVPGPVGTNEEQETKAYEDLAQRQPQTAPADPPVEG